MPGPVPSDSNHPHTRTSAGVDIVFETHSTTTDNEAGIATGWLPGELSEVGRNQAVELGQRRRSDHLAAVYTSDLRRAMETAEIAFAGSGIPISHDPRLRECNYGALNGSREPRQAAERARHIDEPYPGGQSYREVVEQMRKFLRDLAIGWSGHRVLLIGHNATRWALECLLNGASLEALVHTRNEWRPGWHYSLPPAWPDLESTRHG